MQQHYAQLKNKQKKNESVLVLIRIFIIASLLNDCKYTVWTLTLHCTYLQVNKKRNYSIKIYCT